MQRQKIDLIKKALSVKRESKHVEFKQVFDPASPGHWCELIKDLAAIANSGGGIIIFGLDNCGEPTGQSVDGIAAIDPADIENKITKYTGLVDFECEIRSLEKNGSSGISVGFFSGV
jgi:predicted HTH transcriptional regulator